MGTKARLIVVNGARSATIRLTRLPTIIGRSVDASVTVPTTKVSRRHCELYEDDGLYVRDLGSTNGTHVNKQRITEPMALATGDYLKVGPVVFRVHCESETSPGDASVDLDAEFEAVDDDVTGGSVVEHRETEEGSFIDIADEQPSKTADKRSGARKSEREKVAEELTDVVGESENKTVDSGDSALNDFFKNME